MRLIPSNTWSSTIAFLTAMSRHFVSTPSGNLTSMMNCGVHRQTSAGLARHPPGRYAVLQPLDSSGGWKKGLPSRGPAPRVLQRKRSSYRSSPRFSSHRANITTVSRERLERLQCVLPNPRANSTTNLVRPIHLLRSPICPRDSPTTTGG